MSLSETHNLCCAYRENISDDAQEIMAESFFRHLKEKKRNSKSGEAEIRVKKDLKSFKQDVKHCLKGWENLRERSLQKKV